MNKITIQVKPEHLDSAMRATKHYSSKPFSAICLISQAIQDEFDTDEFESAIETTSFGTARVDGTLYRLNEIGRDLVYAFDREDFDRIRTMLPTQIELIGDDY